MKKKAGKRKGGSKAGRGTASTSSAGKNDDAIVDVATQETQPSQEIEETEAKVESRVPAEVEENKEEAEENKVKERVALKHLKEDRVKKFKYCLPYIGNPFKEDETEQSTVVQISFTSKPQFNEVACEYDWAANNLEEETLPADQKDEFMEFVQEEIDKSKTAYEKAKEVREAREKGKEAMSEETKTAYKEMKFYKFYPLLSQDTPDVANIKKSSFINRYFGDAHEVL